jgi:hypothetical protein
MARKKVTMEIKGNPKLFDDRQYGFRSLIECVFHDVRQIHLIDSAITFLNLVKGNGGWKEDDYKKYAVEHYENRNVRTLDLGDGRKISYMTYQTILQTLRSCGMLRRVSGVYKLSGDFATYLNSAQQCWIAFITS